MAADMSEVVQREFHCVIDEVDSILCEARTPHHFWSGGTASGEIPAGSPMANSFPALPS